MKFGIKTICLTNMNIKSNCKFVAYNIFFIIERTLPGHELKYCLPELIMNKSNKWHHLLDNLYKEKTA